MMDDVRRPSNDRTPDSFKGRTAAVAGRFDVGAFDDDDDDDDDEDDDDDDAAVGIVRDARVRPGNIPSSVAFDAAVSA